MPDRRSSSRLFDRSALVVFGASLALVLAAGCATRSGARGAPAIDEARLAAFAKERMGSINACYEAALKREPTLRGEILAVFTILESGRLANVGVRVNTLGSAEVAGCIIDVIALWRTPFRPDEPVTVEYPFVFQPEN